MVALNFICAVWKKKKIAVGLNWISSIGTNRKAANLRILL